MWQSNGCLLSKSVQTIKFSVQGSAEEPYEVEFFRRDDHRIMAFCNCPAGSNAQLCKHRLRILQGSTEAVVGDNVGLVREVAAWVEGSDLGAAMAELHKWEEQAESAKRKINAAKKAILQSLRE